MAGIQMVLVVGVKSARWGGGVPVEREDSDPR
jgi:hypothetical protein